MSHFFDTLAEVIGWIKIAISPLLIGMAIGAGVYLYSPTPVGIIIGKYCIAIGLIAGILWATHIWHTVGTTLFWGRLFSTSESHSKKTNRRGE